MEETSNNNFKRRFNGYMSDFESLPIYDVYQNIKGLLRRFSHKISQQLLTECCLYAASKFLEKQQMIPMLELCSDLADIYKTLNYSVSNDTINNIIHIFQNTLNIKLTDKMLKFRMLSKFLKLSISTQFPNGDPKLHLAASEGYLIEEMYGESQNHLVYCDAPEKLAQLINKWQTVVYPSERFLLILRLTLILLSIDKVLISLKFLKQLPYQYQTEEIPPPLQFAYLISQACYYQDMEFYNKILSKYQLLTKCDPCFGELIQAIDNKIMHKENNITSLFSTLSSMIGL